MGMAESQEFVELEERQSVMTRPYEVVIVHEDLDDWAREVKESVRETGETILSQSEAIGCREVNSRDDLCELSNPEHHVVVLYLGNRAGGQSEAINSALNMALENSISVLPVVRQSDPGDVEEKLPQSVQLLNAADWNEDRGRALTALRQMLGLEESERKVFISYSRQESSEIAFQLHDALSRRKFDVFLDRFSVQPGEDFQRKLDQELADKAFVVLLESPGVRESRWIQHEISYALDHRIGVLAVTMPSVGSESVSVVHEAFRLRLCPTEFAGGGELTDKALERVLSEIELRHAQALRRRREQLLGSLREKLVKDGGCCRPAADWAVVASVPGEGTSAFLITPRSPCPSDLYRLYQIRSNAVSYAGSDLKAVLVHATENISCEQESLIDWVKEGWGLDVLVLQDFNF